MRTDILYSTDTVDAGTYTSYIPIDDLVSWWPDQLFGGLDPSKLGIVGYQVEQGGGTAVAFIDLLVAGGLTLTLADVEGLEIDLHGGEIALEVALSTPFELRAHAFDITLRLRSGLLIPVEGTAPGWIPKLDADGNPEPVAATVSIGSLVVDEDFSPRLEASSELTIGPLMLGDTGIVVDVRGARLHLSGKETPPPGQAAGFRGVSFDRVDVYLPEDFVLPGLTPDAITAQGLVFGNGGVSGSFSGRWDPTWAGTEPKGDSAGTLAGFPFALRSVGIALVQGAIASCGLEGDIALPFLDAVVRVRAGFDDRGRLSLSLAAGEEVLTIPTPVGTFTLNDVGIEHEDETTVLVLGGSVTPTIASPGIQWPTIAFSDLRIASDGSVQLPGGWLTLQTPLALDLFGFGMEVTRIGFGTEQDGRRWIGVDGGIRFLDLLPAGASARGLRAIWDPTGNDPSPQIALDGIGVAFGVPDAFAFEGTVALAEAAGGARLFSGALALGLDALDVGVDAGITIGRDAASTYVFVHLGVNVPIPIGATGAALYGAEGLFAMNMSPNVTNAGWPLEADPPLVRQGDWYGWYKRVPTEFDVTSPVKWAPDIGAWAFGAGLSIGTLPDAGFSVNTRALLVVLLPGPVLLLQGTADIFKPPPALGGAEQEGTLSMLAALDGRAGTLQLGIDAAWSLARIVEIGASTEAYFDFDRSDAWHLWIGKKTPESARIRADYLALWHADAWLMLGARGIDTGLGVSWGDSWRFGPARVTLSSWIGGQASMSRRPPQLAGALAIGGEASVSAGPFGVGIGVEAPLEAASFAPYRVAGSLDVQVGLPVPLKDLDVSIALEWSRPEVPDVEDPWVGALVEHERCTESWVPSSGGDLTSAPFEKAPVVPLDALVVLTFARPMNDLTPAADNPPSPAPVETIGDYTVAYTLVSLRMHRWRRSHATAGWEDVTASLSGSWTPDAGSAGTRLQLFSRNPFAFTRNTSRRWTDSFLAGAEAWPCAPPVEIESTCVNWHSRAPGSTLPSLWTQRGATFSTEAAVSVVVSDDERVLRLGPQTVDGQARPGAMWVSLPEPCVLVNATVRVPAGDWIVMRAWSRGEPVGTATHPPGQDSVELQIVAARVDAVTFAWSATGESELILLCWTTLASTLGHAIWNRHRSGLESAATRWASSEPVLDPDSHYLLEVTTSALLTKGGDPVDNVTTTHTLQFQTGGPPGIVPEWVPAPEAPEAPAGSPPTAPVGTFPHGGVLKDLAPYIRWTIPAAGAKPVFRAYDLGCEFDATHVQQMYGADMRVRVRDGNGRPALGADGGELLFENAWEEAPTTTVTTSESAWLSRLDRCTGAVSWTELRGDDRISTASASLLYDDFSGTGLVSWTPLVLDRSESRRANWHLDGGVLRQDVDIAGGLADPRSPDKPGTVYLAGGIDVADVAIETVGWAGEGAYGLVFRWRGPDDYYRFSAGCQRLRLTRMLGGTARDLWSSNDPYVPGARTRLGVQAEGERIRCQVDDRLVCDLRDEEPSAPASGSVGLYTWNSSSAAFDEVRARPWPGGALSPSRAYVAELEATRPLFTDPFETLDAFEQQSLETGDAATGSSAASGVATIGKRRAGSGSVVALAGDAGAGSYVIECNARPLGEGSFGLVSRHDGDGNYLALMLTTGGGRMLLSRSSVRPDLGVSRILWQDAGAVSVDQSYALSLACEADQVTVEIDDERFTVRLPAQRMRPGRFGLLSGISLPAGCAFTDLVVRSRPPVAVHRWNFTTSRHLGLPDLLDGFSGEPWPVEDAAPDRVALTASAAAAATAMSAAEEAVDAARTALAHAVETGNTVELEPLRAAAHDAAAARDAAAGAAYESLAGALGLPWRPIPPVVEMCTIAVEGNVIGLLSELPEPLPWERMRWTLRGPDHRAVDAVMAWSGDGCRAILTLQDGTAFAAGRWTLDLALLLDCGAERAVWRRGGSTAPETGSLQFTLPA